MSHLSVKGEQSTTAETNGLTNLMNLPTNTGAAIVKSGPNTFSQVTLSGSGTVMSVSVVSANGFSGSVATSTSTPAITLSTSISGMLKGSASALVAATDGSDFLSSSTGLKLDQTSSQTIANGVPIFSSLTASQIAAFDGSSKLQSLAVATYPSLTELTYLKGVTSAIQTQINTKGTGTVTAVSIATANGFSGSSSGGATPALTIIAGAITPTSVNGLTITTSTGTLTVTNLKTISVTNTLTLSGTDSTVMTFPSTSATIARTDAAQTFTGIQTIPQIVNTPLAATVTSNAATITRASRINNFTNSSAATMAITLSTSGALDGDLLMVRIFDFSAVAQTIGWTNTENSTASAPTMSNGSTTLPLSVGFQYNSGSSKWRCIASA